MLLDLRTDFLLSMFNKSGIRVLYVVALATFDLATARAGASRGVGKRSR